MSTGMVRDLAAQHRMQIKSRERVRELAEVYTHSREVNAMLDLVPDMFPTEADPSNTDRKFLEPACGSGNFLEEILTRKLACVTTASYGTGVRYEHRILRALASIYAIDINEENVYESRERMRAVIRSHVDNDLNTKAVTSGFSSAVEVILVTNVILANALTDAHKIRLVDYQAKKVGFFQREVSFMSETDEDSLFGSLMQPPGDIAPVHYADLMDTPLRQK